jgi:hypothetical protein
MKRIKLFLSIVLLMAAPVVFGQTEKNISVMKEGTVLTDADIGFLSLVANATIEASRGNATREVTIAGSTYRAGHVLTAKEAKSLNKAIKAFQKTYKAPEASRGAGLCYYWYYYCDGWGYCYWYKYWYYC